MLRYSRAIYNEQSACRNGFPLPDVEQKGTECFLNCFMNTYIRSIENLGDNQLDVVSGSAASTSDGTRATGVKTDVAYKCGLETEEEIVNRLVKAQIYKDCKSFDDILETQRKNLEESMASYGGKQNEGKVV